MHAHDHQFSPQHRQTHYRRVLMFFVLLFLALQLTGALAHNHAYAEHEPDCAACFVADMPGDGPPPASVAVIPLALPGSLPAPLPSAVPHPAQAGYLTPPSHAPPGVAVSSI